MRWHFPLKHGLIPHQRRPTPTTRGNVRQFLLTCFLLVVFQAHASAEDCPDFFRFVDFGLKAQDGTINRGGPTYRAEGFDGEALLIRDLTVCRAALELAVDGRGNKIPVVTSVSYSPEKTGIDLAQLRLVAVEDAASETERNAADHRARLERPDTVTTQGSTHLCASIVSPPTTSCQLVSPFGGNLALVIYCDAGECRMPALAVRDQIIATATWLPSPAAMSNPEALAAEIADRVQQIHDFLAPLSS